MRIVTHIHSETKRFYYFNYSLEAFGWGYDWFKGYFTWSVSDVPVLFDAEKKGKGYPTKFKKFEIDLRELCSSHKH